LKWGLVEANAATKVRPPRQTETERVTWDEDELRAFLEANDANPHIWLFRLAIETGMRRGELLALRWDNVDLERGVVRVRETLSRDEKGAWVVSARPKTQSGHRDILVAPSTGEGLRAVRTSQLRRRLAFGSSWHNTDLVFDRGDGRRLDPEALRNAFRKAADVAGVPQIRFHDLRHSCATLMMANNVHQTIGQARLGHKSAKSMKPYLYPALEMQRPVVELFEERIFRPRMVEDREDAV
jgi:integrase